MADIAAQPLPVYIEAGDFGAWLSATRAMLRGEPGPVVPCGECVGCCVSSYPVPVRAHEKTALNAIPVKHLATARNGQRMIVALPDGRCPMHAGTGCAIYSNRPQTCRDYDCRIFAAAGIEAGGHHRSVINDRVRSWQFRYRTRFDLLTHQAVKSAASFIFKEGHSFPGRAPSAPTGIAVLAIKVYPVFLDRAVEARSPRVIVESIIQASREFDSTMVA